jgi:hypothetical protein
MIQGGVGRFRRDLGSCVTQLTRGVSDIREGRIGLTLRQGVGELTVITVKLGVLQGS